MTTHLVTNYTAPNLNELYKTEQNLIKIKETSSPTSPLKILGIILLVVGVATEVAMASIALKIGIEAFVTVGMALSFTTFAPIALVATGALLLIIAGAILIAQKSNH